MSSGLSIFVVLSLFLILTSVVFTTLTGSWTDRSIETAQAIERQRARVESAITINSASETGLTCTSYTVQVNNAGEVSVDDFSEMDLLVDYTNSSNNKVAVRLAHDIAWSVAGLAPDTEETTTEHTVVLGSSSDTWGRTWSISDFTNANFRVRATTIGVGGRDYFLDGIPVNVHYAPQ